MEWVYSGSSTNSRMVPPAMTRTGWCFLGFLFFMLSVVLLSSSCSQRQEQEATLCPTEQSIERAVGLLFPEFIIVLEDALEVKTIHGGWSVGDGLFIDYGLESAPPQASEAATRLKQKLESLGAKGVEAGVLGSVIIVDFEQFPFKGYVWQGFIQVYDQRLSGYLKPIHSGG